MEFWPEDQTVVLLKPGWALTKPIYFFFCFFTKERNEKFLQDFENDGMTLVSHLVPDCYHVRNKFRLPESCVAQFSRRASGQR